jgi:outer membrane protease
MQRNIYASVLALGILSSTGAAMAQDANPNFSFQGGIGYTFLEGNELVYDGAGNRISHLIWETQAPVLNLKARAGFSQNWSVTGSATIGFSGDSHMEDYDWLAPYSPSFAFDDWSHRSIHPDTDLDQYLDIDLAIGRDFQFNDQLTVNLHGGLQYTNVKWTAYGGSFTYSVGGFRDTSGNFPDGERGISFEQRYPGAFVGAEATIKNGAWTFSGLARAGVSINASDTDHHWMRDLRFEEEYSPIPFVTVGGQVDYAYSERTSFFLGGEFENFFRKKGDTVIYDIPSGAQLAGPFEDGAGMDFRSVTLTAGIKMNF